MLRYLILSIILINCLAQEENGVLVLNDQNFDKSIKEHQNLLVLFYNDSDFRCQRLAPHYENAAKQLKEKNFYLGKVDGIKNQDLINKFEVTQYPTIVFFRKGQQLRYSGSQVEEGIVEWGLSKVQSQSSEIKCSDLDNIKQLGLVYVGELDDKFEKVYQELGFDQKLFEKIEFYHLSDKDCAAKLNLNQLPAILLYRSFEESPVQFQEDFNIQQIVTFVKREWLPTLINFNTDYLEPIFGQKNNAIFLFRNKEDDSKPFSNIFQEASKVLKGQIYFVKSDVEDGILFKMAEQMGVLRSLPAIIILEPTKNKIHKYLYQGDINQLTVNNLKDFIDKFNQGQLQKFYKSEEVPSENQVGAKVIVGKNYIDMVKNTQKDILVNHFQPWESNFKRIKKSVDRLAKEFKEVDDIVIAHYNISANEIEGLDIKHQVKLFTKDNQDGIVYNGEGDFESLKEWVEIKSPGLWNYMERKGEL